MAVESLHVKERVLLHLFDYNRFEEEFTVPPDVTQKGIADAVGIRVHHVTQNTRPLISEDLVKETSRHIRGKPRRQKAYFLSPSGRSRVASLRSSLLKTTAPFKAESGELEEIALTTIYHERRNGSTLIELLEELRSVGYVREGRSESPPAKTVDLSEDAPGVGAFYGREEELTEVLQSIRETPLVVVTGIAGIGKSTLGSKVCDELRGKRSLFWSRIRPWTGSIDLARDLGRFLRACGRIRLDSYMAQSTTKDMGRIESALAIDLAGLPGVLVFDDVHAASQETMNFLSMLHSVLQRQPGCSALLLTREQPPFYSRRDVEMEETVREVSIGALDERSSEAILREGGIRGGRARNLSKLSGGSPLFLRILSRARTQEEVRKGLETLEDYIAEEIEPTLDDEERGVMQAASLYEVPVPAAALLLEARSGTGVLLSLYRKGLLDKVGTERFSLHDAVRSYFLADLHPDWKRPLAEEAASWLLDESEQSALKGNMRIAMSQIENAAAIDTSNTLKMKILERLGDVRIRIGDAVGAESAFRRALEKAQDPGKVALFHVQIASALETQGKYDEELEEVDRGLSLLPASPSREGAWLLYMKAEAVRWKGDYDSASAGYAKVWEWLKDFPEESTLRATIASWMGVATLYDPTLRDPVAAKKLFNTAIEAAQTGVHRKMLAKEIPLAQGHLFIAFPCLQMGEIEEALDHIEKARVLFEEAGLLTGRLWTLSLRGWCLSECLGQTEEAAHLYVEAHRIAREISNDLRELWLYRSFADLYRSQGRDLEAKESQEHFLSTCSDLVWGDNRVEALVLMVRLCVLSGDLDVAQTYLEEAEALATEPSSTARFYLGWARAALHAERGAKKDARKAYAEALDIGSMYTRPVIFAEFLATLGNKGEFLLDYGLFLSSIGESSHAKHILREAKDEFSNLGREPFLMKVEGSLSTLESLPEAKSPS